MAQYGKSTYWDERYTKDPEPFDWYQRYSGIKDKLRSYTKENDHILQLGCGNSSKFSHLRPLFSTWVKHTKVFQRMRMDNGEVRHTFTDIPLFWILGFGYLLNVNRDDGGHV